MAMTASLITVPEHVAEQPDATRFGIRPVPGTSSMTGDDVQDLVVQLPGDEDSAGPLPEVVLSFATAAGDLGSRVAETCDSVYIVSGAPGLQALRAAIRGTEQVPVFGSAGVPAGRRGEVIYLDEERSPRRHRILAAFEAYLKDLPQRRAGVEAVAASAAADSARTRLERSRQEVLSEARRYLSLADRRPEMAQAVLEGPRSVVRLTGPDLIGLARDLLTIASARDELDQRTAAQRRATERWDAAKRSVFQDELERRQTRQGQVYERDIFDLARGMAQIPDPPEVAAARERLSDQRMILTRLVAELASDRTILFKLWNTDLPFEIRDLLSRARATNALQQQAALAASVPVRDGVLDALTSTWRAAGDLLQRFTDDPAAPFRFPALIESTLTGLHVQEADFEWRAAQDRIRAEQPAAELAAVSTWLGHVGLAAGLSGAGPLAATASLLQIVVDSVALIEKGLLLYEQHLGVTAFFAPSSSLAVDPTWSALAIDVFWLGLNIWLSRGDIGRLVKP